MQLVKELLFFTAEELPLIQVTHLFLGARSNLFEVFLIIMICFTLLILNAHV